ncbi:MAG: hypothetical protein J1E61_07410 [Lachnospiraceae bacterium]|nr:hypothetical protein [Lachnospiraceae bacterium]
MKKRVFALVCAMVLMFAMSINVFAAESPNSQDVVEENTNEAADPAPAPAAPDATLTIGTQTLDAGTLASFASTTKVTSASGVDATIAPVSADVARAAVAQAKAVVGNNATIATVVDLVVPEGTGKASFTLTCNVAAGQNVTILHQKKDGSWEAIKPSNVSNGSVTFTLSSYSPVAVVVNGTAPKTYDIIMMVAGVALVCLAGVAVFGRKAKLS